MTATLTQSGGRMLGKRTLLSLVLVAVSAQADSPRREPSLFLEYERALKKAGDTQKEEETPFIKSLPAPVSLVKPTPPSTPVVKAPVPSEVVMPVLKNTKMATDTIGNDEHPFLSVAKPAPVNGSLTCPDGSAAASPAQNGTKSFVANLKNAKEKVLARAKEFLGTPYGFGNKTGERTDCSGFTQQVYRQFGISLPRSAAEQAQLGESVDLADLQVGDLLFYRTYKSDPSHVAIYAGNGQIIHASFSAKKVQYDSIEKEYYKKRFLYAKRLPFQENDYHD